MQKPRKKDTHKKRLLFSKNAKTIKKTHTQKALFLFSKNAKTHLTSFFFARDFFFVGMLSEMTALQRPLRGQPKFKYLEEYGLSTIQDLSALGNKERKELNAMIPGIDLNALMRPKRKKPAPNINPNKKAAVTDVRLQVSEDVETDIRVIYTKKNCNKAQQERFETMCRYSLFTFNTRSPLGKMARPMLPHLPKDVANIVAEYCSEHGNRLKVIVSMDFAELKWRFEHGVLPPDFGIVFEFFELARTKFNESLKVKKFEPMCLPPPLEPEFKCSDIPLHDYQVATVTWMSALEADIANGRQWQPLTAPLNQDCSWPGLHNTWKFNSDTFGIAFEQNDVPIPTVTTRGGVLADEVGLGKTLTCIDLINRTATSTPVPSRTFGLRYETNCSLVICPNQLVAQWRSEFEKHAPGLDVRAITTMREFMAATANTFLTAHVVIVSFQFLTGVALKKHEDGLLSDF